MWQVVGHTRVVSLLQRSLEQETVAHAYLLVGPAHVGKTALALNLAQALNCESATPPCGECAPCRKIASGKHADVQIIGLAQNTDSDETKPRAEIGIDQIRQMQHSASLPPFEGEHKVYIIDEAEKLSTEAANCLLKTLEEPAGKVIFTLLATDDRLLPATVVSRCQRLELSPLTPGEVESALTSQGVEPSRAELLARLSRGCPGWALSATADASLLEQRAERIDRLIDVTHADYAERFDYAAQLATQFGQKRGTIYEILDLWLNWWRDLLLVKANCPEAVTNVDRLNTLAEMAQGYRLAQIRAAIGDIQAAGEQLRLNANPRLALETLMLNIPEKSRR